MFENLCLCGTKIFKNMFNPLKTFYIHFNDVHMEHMVSTNSLLTLLVLNYRFYCFAYKI